MKNEQLDATRVCPGEDCPMCSGQSCDLCGAGSWNIDPHRPRCEHDVLERHTDPAVAFYAEDPLLKWYVFTLPAATSYVPADSEEAARRALTATCYSHAPVHAWPCLGFIITSRRELLPYMLKRAAKRTARDVSPG